MAAAPAIDPRIQDLPSTTFFGKRLTRRQIADVQEMVQACSGLSRTELAKTVCEHLHWKVGSGASRVRLATRLLEQLAEHGIVSLPAKRPRPRGPDRAVPLTDRTAPQPPIASDLASLRPVRLEAVADRRRRQFTALWEDLLAAIGDRLRRYDREWMQRRRKVNTLLVVLFVFRLVLAPRLQGYGPTLTELWGQCRQQGLFPPHDDPVSASSMCVARGKLGRRPFLRMQRALLDRKRYSRHALADLYHARWGVEEHYKVVKRLLRLEPFHGQSEDLVLQELWACCTLIAMTRLFANHCEAEMPSAAGKPPLRANFNNSLRTVSQHVEWLLLQQSAALSTTVDSILRSMDCCRQRERPNRSYPRVSRRPDDRWRPSKKK